MTNFTRWLIACAAVVTFAFPAAASCPPAPTLTNPPDGATTPFGPKTLTWTASAGADEYEVFIALDGDVLSSLGGTTGTSKTITLEPGRSVEWKVVARSSACPAGTESALATFTTTCPTEPPNPQNPGNGVHVAPGASVNFSWGAVPGAASYDLNIFVDGQWQILAENLTIRSHTSSFTVGEYQWNVRANFNGSCTPLYSDARTFFVEAGCSSANPKPVLVAPAKDAIVGSPVEFRWNAASGAVGYDVVVSVDGAAAQVVASTTALSATVPLSGRRVRWFVRASFGGECTTVSNLSEFELTGAGGCPANPGRASLTSPAAGATSLSSPVSFRWNAVPGATGYRVLAAVGGSSQPVILGETTGTRLEAALPAGQGFWLVQTLFGDGCATTLSDRRTFQVTSGAPCSGAAPQPVTPSNGSTQTSTDVTFSWTGVAGATRYRLFVATGDEEFSPYGETESTSIGRRVPRGVIRWFVVASSAACPDTRSATVSFTVAAPADCATATLALLRPARDATTGSPVSLAWSSVPNADTYRVWISVEGEAPVIAHRSTATEATLALPAGEIRWYVEALRDGCVPVVSDPSRFHVTPGANCAVNTPPAVASPAGTEAAPALVTSPVSFTWTGSPQAFGYRVWIARRGQAFEDVGVTRETRIETAVDPGSYVWFVQALFEGCGPLSSAQSFFEVQADRPRCPSEAPSIVAPRDGAVSGSPVSFLWTAVAGAEKYRVYASLDGGEPLLLGVTTTTSLTRPMPPGTIRWSVEAVFASCPSTFSSRETFSIALSQNCPSESATLASPANGSTRTETSVDFAWSAVSGAIRYVVVARVNDGSPTVLAATSDTHATVDLAPGRVEWWVVTFLSGCPATESAHSRFQITARQDCANGRPLLLLPTSLRDEVTSPAHFQWTAVPNAHGYRVWLAPENGEPSIAATTAENTVRVELLPGTHQWFVEALFDGCPSLRSAKADFQVIAAVACDTPGRPLAQVIGQALSGTPYTVRWTPLGNVELYEVQEAKLPDFSDAQTFTTTRPFLRFEHEHESSTQYLYRVRGVSDCNDERGRYSLPVGIYVVPQRSANGSVEAGNVDTVVQKLFLPGSTAPVTFTASADKPWVTVTPSSGILPTEGTTLTISAAPDKLALGTNTATILVQYGSSANGPRTDATTIKTTPFSVSVVTPVIPAGKGTPPDDSLIFTVGHAVGANDSLFQSDIRVVNLAAETMKYQLNFTPSNADGTLTGSSTTVEIAPGSTLALDDVVTSVFGTATLSSATGVLEIRPLVTTSGTSNLLAPASAQLRALTTGASSRTYNFTPNGTFGQFIPATRFSDFVGKAAPGLAPAILSLQQVSQSSAYRSNFGFVEAFGKPADLLVRVYDTSSNLLQTIPLSLRAGEHRQVNAMLAANGIAELGDGRVEVEVVGGEGKVTAFVSTVDNRTNDPLLASATVKGAVLADRYVIPGAAFIDNVSAFWVTDIRIFNEGATATPATLTFYPSGNPAAATSREIMLEPGEIEVLDNVVGGLFALPNGSGGMIAITTPAPATLAATARTYNSTSGGTYGQYIPGVTVAQSAGLADRALQVMQLEQSSRFRTNVGLAETSGQPATVEVSLILPSSLVTPVVTFELAGNDFRQFPLSSFGVTEAIYNARVSVKVIGGAGRVTAYGSAIDQITQDPTYVPAQ